MTQKHVDYPQQTTQDSVPHSGCMAMGLLSFLADVQVCFVKDLC